LALIPGKLRILALSLTLFTAIVTAPSLWADDAADGLPSGAIQCLDSLGRPAAAAPDALPTRLSRLGQGHHLMLLQEALQNTASSLASQRPLHAGFAPGYRTEDLISGVLSLSAAQATGQCSLSADEPWLGTPKAIHVTEYPLADTTQRLLVINLHAINFTLGLKAFREQLTLFRGVLLRHKGPAIVAGDFNTWNDARRAYVTDFTRELGLQEVAFQPDLRTRFLNNPLDGFFVRDLQPTTAEVVTVESSDHNPMLVTLEVVI